MFCTNCGERLEDGMLFCPNCGTKIIWEEPKAEEPKAEEVKIEEPKVEEVMAEEPKAEEPKVEEVMAEELKAEVAEAEAVKVEEPKAEAVKVEEPKAGEPKVEEPKAEGKKKSGYGALVFVFCLLIFICGTTTALSASLRLSYSESKVRSLMERLDVTEITVPSTQSKQEIPLVDFLEEASGFDFEKTAGVQKKDVEKLLAKSYVTDMATDYIAGYAGYFFSGEKPKAFTRDDVVDFVKEHDDDFFELMKFRFTYPDPVTKQRTVYTVDIDNAFKDLGTDEITLDWVQKSSGVNFSLIKTLLSIPVLIAGVCVCLVLAIINLFVAGKKAGGLKADGITAMITGILVAGMAGIGFLRFGGSQSSILLLFLSPLFKNALIIGVVILVVGILLLVLATASGKKSSKATNS